MWNNNSFDEYFMVARIKRRAIIVPLGKTHSLIFLYNNYLYASIDNTQNFNYDKDTHTQSFITDKLLHALCFTEAHALCNKMRLTACRQGDRPVSNAESYDSCLLNFFQLHRNILTQLVQYIT